MEYASEFPKCVTETWLERLPGDEAERAKRIEYALRAKQVAVMRACYEPGQPPIPVISAPAPGRDLDEELAKLRAEYDELKAEIASGKRCGSVAWRPPVVGGQGPGTEPAVGAADPVLWQKALASALGKGKTAPEVLATAVGRYEEAWAAANKVRPTHATVCAWRLTDAGSPGELRVDLSRPDGQGGFAACDRRPITGLADRLGNWPRCVPVSRAEKLAAEDPRLARWATLTRQVAALERCPLPRQALPPTRLRPSAGADLDREIRELEERRTTLMADVAAGERCQQSAPPVRILPQVKVRTLAEAADPRVWARVVSVLRAAPGVAIAVAGGQVDVVLAMQDQTLSANVIVRDGETDLGRVRVDGLPLGDSAQAGSRLEAAARSLRKGTGKTPLVETGPRRQHGKRKPARRK